MSRITYNHLNLPHTISGTGGERTRSSHTKWLVGEVKRSFRPTAERGAISGVKTLCATAKVLLREISNVYDAAGRKWQSTQAGVTTTYFVDIEYERPIHDDRSDDVGQCVKGVNPPLAGRVAAIKAIYHQDGERTRSSHTKWLVAEVKRNVRTAVKRGAAMESKHFVRQPKCFCGRILNNNGSYEYQYYIKDHTPRRTCLGNVRIVCNSAAVIQSEQHYYPFGERTRSSHTKWLVGEVKRNVRTAVKRGAAMESKHFVRQPKCFCGRILNNNGSYEYQYYIKDHTPRRTCLGNVRIVCNTAAVIQSEQHYYPFGLNMEGNFTATGYNQKYRYNGKELYGGLGWYDYGARYYDPSVGRFTTVDPLAEMMPSYSPYAYTFNNPMIHTDPTGMAPKRRNVFELHAEQTGQDDISDGLAFKSDRSDSQSGSGGNGSSSGSASNFGSGNSSWDGGGGQSDKNKISNNSNSGVGGAIYKNLKEIITSSSPILSDDELFAVNTISGSQSTFFGFSSISLNNDRFLFKTFKLFDRLNSIGNLISSAQSIHITYSAPSRENILSQSYNLAGNILSMGVAYKIGAAYGGPYGAAAGLGVDVGWYTAPITYNLAKSGVNNFIKATHQVSYGLQNGAIPYYWFHR